MQLQLGLRLGLAFVLLGGAVFAAPPALKPVHTNKTGFRIPFRFDAAALQKMNAKEIHLYVSTDRGKTWEFAQSITPDPEKPDQSRFLYNTPGDGEYWFSVKTLDANNQLQPGGKSFEPALMVIVDTTEPQLDLTLEHAPSGKVRLAWQAADNNLEISTLKLEYLQPGMSEWQAVSVIPQPTGQTAWSVSGSGMVSVRGTITDLAGNTGRAERQISIQPADSAGLAETRRPVPGSSASPGERFPAIEPKSASNAANKDSANSGSLVMPFTARSGSPAKAGSPTNWNDPNSNFGGSQVTTTSAIGSNPFATNGGAANGFSSMANNGFNANSGVSPSVQNGLPNFNDPGPIGGSLRNSGSQRVVNQKRFQVAYQVDDVGPSGIANVELFITQDHGQKWFKYGDDPDMKSPFDVEVKRDGTYGFAIRARSGAGFAADPPAPGEPPSVTVSVDTTPPAIEILPVQQGHGASSNRLLIRWKMTDDHPADRPIALYYATSRDGAWEQICDWQADTGSYVWTLSRGMPSQFYIRVVGRDAAGNFGKAETPQPLNIDLARPTARIVDVEPVGAPN